MIELHFHTSPNPMKVLLMLEEQGSTMKSYQSTSLEANSMMFEDGVAVEVARVDSSTVTFDDGGAS